MKQKKRIIGLLAHVDAGKTTLAERILYAAGEIRNLGRVDHRDTFLDTDRQERERGITIFSKQARFSWQDMEVTLLDTPGHIDFSAEMERTLQVLDCAVLIVNGADGVQSHTLTLWKLLERYQVPVFIFVNKMDQPGTDERALLAGLKSELDERCVSFTDSDGNRPGDFYENIAVCDEALLEKYLERTENLPDGAETLSGEPLVREQEIADLIDRRRLFPCLFGSALKGDGVEKLLNLLSIYSPEPQYREEFGARVFKITRDAQGSRLTHIKVTGGGLKVKQTIKTAAGESDQPEVEREEKIDQIRLYSGEKYTTVQEIAAGSVCALTGPVHTFCGQGIGAEEETVLPVLEPVMTYRIELPDDCDVHHMYTELCKLEEEEPQLHIVWQEESSEIRVQLMGEVQIEILKNLIQERFGVAVDFVEGSILYKETIADVVEGVGHFEPLRHYAEVHLILEPGERGSGLVFRSQFTQDRRDTKLDNIPIYQPTRQEGMA
nr:GTP-binding protein [Lachnospiraceae bacterium]